MAKVILPTHKKVLISEGQALASSVLLILCGIAFSRSMVMSAYGELEAAEGALAIAAIIAAVGLDHLVVRAMRTSTFGRRWDDGRGFRHFAPRLIIGMSVLTWIALGALHWKVHEQSAVRFESLIAVLGLLPLVAINAFLLGMARAHGASRQAKTALYIKGHLLLLGLILIARWVFGDAFDVLHAATVLAIAYGASCWMLLRVIRDVEHAQYRGGGRTYRHRHWIGTGMLFLASLLLLIVLERGGVIVLGWVHADAEASARFGAAARLAFPVAFLALGACGSFLPALSDAIDHGSGLKALRRVWTRMLLGPVLACLVVIGVLGGWLLSFFGAGFPQAWSTLLVLLVAQSVAAMAWLSLPVLVYLGRGGRACGLLLIWAAVGVAGMLVGGGLARDLGMAPEFGVAAGQAIGLIGAHVNLLVWARHAVASGSGAPEVADDDAAESPLIVEGSDADAAASET